MKQIVPRYHIILVTIDCLRTDFFNYLLKIGKLKNMTKLISNGLYFTRAYSTAPWTLPSVVSFLSSTYPLMFEGYLNFSPRIYVPEILKSVNYITLSHQTNAWISKFFFMNKGFMDFLDEFGGEYLIRKRLKSNKKKITGIKLLKRELPFSSSLSTLSRSIKIKYKHKYQPYINAFLLSSKNIQLVKKYKKAIISGKKKLFLWVHYMDLHEPYFDASENIIEIYKGIKIHDKIRLNKEVREDEVRWLISAYLRRLIRVDKAIGYLLSHLEEYNIDFSNSFFILTSDHGQEFFEHGLFGHGLHLYNEIIQVPLIFSGPDIKRGILRYPVSLIDIAPTILSLIGIPAQYKKFFYGRDLSENLVNGVKIEESSPIFSEEGVKNRRSAFREKTRIIKLDFRYRRIAVIMDKWKYIYNYDGRKELYDLRRDPAEHVNLVEIETDIANYLNKLVLNHLKVVNKTSKWQRMYMKLKKLSI